MAAQDEISAREFLALDDDELVDLLKRYPADGGGIAIPVNDLDELSDSEQQSIRERLLHAQQVMGAENMPPIDLNKVNDQLAKALNGHDRRPKLDQPIDTSDSTRSEDGTEDESGAATEVEDLIGSTLLNEQQAYASLLQEGGRPLYPLQLIEEVSQSPEKHRKILLPFWQHPGIHFRSDNHLDWETFHRQLRQWRLFRTWQLDNRGIIEEPDFDAYVREHKDFLTRGYKGKGVAEIEANPESLKGPGTQWELEQATRDRERQTNREPDCETFEQYQQALKKRLSSHGYNTDVAFLEEPKAQNALTEWVEYLGFECWWKDEYIREYERRNDIYTRRWEYIRGQNWVGSDETPELLDSWEAYDQRQALRQQSQRDVDKARQAVDDAKNQLSGVDLDRAKKSDVSSTLDAALRGLEQAEARYSDVDRRNQLIARLGSDRRGCQAAKQYIDSQSALLDWASQQIPLIKAEMSRSANGGRGIKNRKRRAEVDIDVSAADASHKHRKSASPAPDGKEERTHSRKGNVSKQALSKVPEKQPATNEPRRSARLAAQKAGSKPAATPSLPSKSETKKPLRKGRGPERTSETQTKETPRAPAKRSRENSTRNRK